MASDRPRTPPLHVCNPVYVTEGEAVCFGCRAHYIYAGTIALEDISEYRKIVSDRQLAPYREPAPAAPRGDFGI